MFSESEPFFESFTNAEEELLVPSLVAFFRINFKSTVNELLDRFLSNEGQEALFLVHPLLNALSHSQAHTHRLTLTRFGFRHPLV